MALLILASLILMILDQHLAEFAKLRAGLSITVAPVRYLVHMPISSLHWLTLVFSERQQLLKENAELHANEQFLQARIHALNEANKVNGQLQSQLSENFRAHNKLLVAELLAVDVDSSSEQIVVNKGKRDKVYLGQPVLDAYGVLGQVIEAGPITSLVMLLTDAHSAIPVQVERTGIRAIAVGSGDRRHLSLLQVSDTSDIAQGDRLLSSGLGLRYPAGYPVGIVDKVEHLAGHGFAVVKALPTAHLRQSWQVLLVWPSHASFLPIVQEQLKKSPLQQLKPTAHSDAETGKGADAESEDETE